MKVDFFFWNFKQAEQKKGGSFIPMWVFQFMVLFPIISHGQIIFIYT